MSKEMFTKCEACPRRCGVDRTRGELGACGAPATPKLARAALHAWEEPSISGTRGSGTVFFSGCPLGCAFCQNSEIAHGAFGCELSEDELCRIFLRLEREGAHNINLVTPTHYAPLLAEVIPVARRLGLTLPIVYNSGGYERVEMLALLRGRIDVYLPDYKFADSLVAERYAGAPDYPEVARAAIEEMVGQCGMPQLDGEGLMRRGVIVRHLMLPGAYRNSHDVLKHLAGYGDRIYISLMNQFTPMPACSRRFPELSAPIRPRDYRRLVAYAVRLGLTQVYVQEEGTVDESFIPPFDLTGVR